MATCSSDLKGLNSVVFYGRIAFTIKATGMQHSQNGGSTFCALAFFPKQ